MLSVVAACLSCCRGGRGADAEYTCKAMQVDGGYGYVVLHGGDTVVYQPYVPGVSGKLPFATEEDAVEIGRLVCDKLERNQAPGVSREEVERRVR